MAEWLRPVLRKDRHVGSNPTWAFKEGARMRLMRYRAPCEEPAQPRGPRTECQEARPGGPLFSSGAVDASGGPVDAARLALARRRASRALRTGLTHAHAGYVPLMGESRVRGEAVEWKRLAYNQKDAVAQLSMSVNTFRKEVRPYVCTGGSR